MYKVPDTYKECHILDMNLIGIHELKKSTVRAGDFALTLLPLAVFFGLSFFLSGADLSFLAECQNVSGGDICHISIK